MRKKHHLLDTLNERSLIFTNNHEAITHLIDNGLLHFNKMCNNCNELVSLSINKKYHNGLVFACINKNCRKIEIIFKNLLIEHPKIPLNDYLFTVFKWIGRNLEKNVLLNSNISKKSYQAIKKTF